MSSSKVAVLAPTVGAVLIAVFAFADRAGSQERSPARAKLGYVDTQRVLEESDAGKSVLTKLRARVEGKHTELKVERDALQEEDRKLAAEKGTLAHEEFEKRRIELQRRGAAWQESYQTFQKLIQEEEARLTQDILIHVRTACAQLGRTEGVDCILNASTVLYAPPASDFTNEVIVKVNKLTGGEKK